jgi:hypothetical protein
MGSTVYVKENDGTGETFLSVYSSKISLALAMCGDVWIVLHPACRTFGERGLCIHWLERWEGPIASLDKVEKCRCSG